MITSLHIQNFQSHPDTKLEFDPGVNVIVGSSDSGKTAIIRALRWAVWNKPLGDAFRSDWGGDTSVTAFLDFGAGSVERFKGKGGDRYAVWKEGQLDETKLKAFGTTPPEEVDRLFNIKELNLQSQLDSPFLLSQSAGEVARYFNRIARIDQIDSSMQTVERWVRKINQDIASQESQITQHQQTLQEFEYLDKMESEVEVLEDMQSRRDKTARGSQTLETKLKELQQVEEEMEAQILAVRAEQAVGDILALFDRKDTVQTRILALSKVIEESDRVKKQAGELKEEISSEKLVTGLLELYQEQEKVAERFQRLGRALTQYRTTKKEYEEQQTKLEELEQQWHEHFPNECPMCGSRVEEDGKFTIGPALREQFNAGVKK